MYARSLARVAHFWKDLFKPRRFASRGRSRTSRSARRRPLLDVLAGRLGQPRGLCSEVLSSTRRPATWKPRLEGLEQRQLLSVTPQLFDIGRIPADSRITEFVEAGGMLYFGANDGVTGDELWKTDGTSEGTALVKDIAPGPAFSGPTHLTVVGNNVFFTALDGAGRPGVYVTDGSAEGTYALLPPDAAMIPSSLTALNDQLLFNLYNLNTGSGGLWISDGTSAGTRSFDVPELKAITWATSDQHGILYFSGTDGVHGYELWRSDGTAAGTHMVYDIHPGAGDSWPGAGVATDGGVLFVADDGVHGPEVWKSDGTPEGTTMVKDIRSGPIGFGGGGLTKVGNDVFFYSFNSLASIWTTDGTEAGTVLVKNRITGVPSNLTSANGRLFFVTLVDGNPSGAIWTSDGTSAGTIAIPDAFGASLLAFGDGIVFLRDNGTGLRLWKSDGTAEGTQMISDLKISALGAFDNSLFLAGDDGVYGSELWRSDGTSAGSSLVKDINPDAVGSSDPENLTDVDGMLYFTAHNVYSNHHKELWKSDGTIAGTQLVKEFPPLSECCGVYLHSLPSGGGSLYFLTSNDGQLWKSDGTEAGTLPLGVTGFGSPADLADIDGTLFLDLGELWKSDGTADGTVLVKDITPGSQRTLDLGGFFDLNGTLLFTAKSKLWKSDGTTEGTVQLADVTPVGGMTIANGVAYFAGSDATHNLELWRTDGTLQGTSLVKDVAPGSKSSFIEQIIEFDDVLYFAASDGVNGFQLWRSDGTDVGTHAVAGAPTFRNQSPFPVSGWSTITATDESLFFIAESELWKSDGTEAGTQFVSQLPYATDPSGNNLRSFYRHLTPIGNDIVFTLQPSQLIGGGEFAATQLWTSDGTEAGTHMVGNISNAESFTHVGDSLFFVGDDGVHGTELWVIPSSSVVVDTTPPSGAIVPPADDPWQAHVDSLDVVFSEPVEGLDLADLVLTRNGTAIALAASAILSTSNGVDWPLSGLTDELDHAGVYEAEISAMNSAVADLAGNSLSADMRARWISRPGDADDDGRVSLLDFQLLKENFGRSDGVTFGDGDFNGDGRIDLVDFQLLRGNFGRSATAPAIGELL